MHDLNNTEHSGEMDNENLQGKEPTPQWDMFLIRGASFAKSLDEELIVMNTAVDDEGTEQSEFEDMVTDIEDMELELKGLEVSWKSIISVENSV